jgi:uncharacterized protein with PQ loop repeat
MSLLGLAGIFLMNVSMLPQILRIIKLKNSKAISITNVVLTGIALIIFYEQAAESKNTLFCINYIIGTLLQTALLITTLLYRKPRRRYGK